MGLLPSDEAPRKDERDTTTYYQQELLPAMNSYMSLCAMKGRGDSPQAIAVEGHELMKIAATVAVRRTFDMYAMMGGPMNYSEYAKQFLGNMQTSIDDWQRHDDQVRDMMRKAHSDTPLTDDAQ